MFVISCCFQNDGGRSTLTGLHLHYSRPVVLHCILFGFLAAKTEVGESTLPNVSNGRIRVAALSGSHRGAGTRRGFCLCLVFARRIRSHSVVLCHSLDYPKADHSIKTWCGWAGREPEGHDVTPMPSRKKERRERPEPLARLRTQATAMIWMTTTATTAMKACCPWTAPTIRCR